MSQTPIYDQLRGERINADVPATGAQRQQVSDPGHRLATVDPAVAAFGPPPETGS